MSLPRAVEHACPILVPINGGLCTMWARLFLCVGPFRAQAEEGEGVCSPRRKAT